jgi:hypothetical protein
MIPFIRPAIAPANKHAITASGALRVTFKVTEKASMPNVMIDGNDKSISPEMITSVNGSATSAKNGVVVMYAA